MSRAEARIEAALAAVAGAEGVSILLAVEAGSRAFGFPSPDSDFDVRFGYAHPLDWYVSVLPKRDVIERLGDGLDLVGWDVRKALGLLLKPNPVLLEWLSSPIRYRWNAPVCAELAAFARRAAPARAAMHHYRRLCEKIVRTEIARREAVAPKHYLYAVRAALALRHARSGAAEPPPMDLARLVEGADLGPQLVADIDRLVAGKRAGTMQATPRLPRLDDFLAAELAAADPPAASPREDLTEQADSLLRRIVRGAFDPA